MTTPLATAQDLPLLGEPLPVEFANTLYGSGDPLTDFLATPDLIRLWFSEAVPARGLILPALTRPGTGHAIRALRDAIHRLLHDCIDGRAPSRPAIATLNNVAARAPTHLRLQWDAGTSPQVSTVFTGSALELLLGQIAHQTLTLFTGPDREHLRRCRGPGCAMLYLQRHRNRRWCHHSCGHRARQAAYYRRMRYAHYPGLGLSDTSHNQP